METASKETNVKDMQKKIALQCMQNFDLIEHIRTEFAENNKLYYSERMSRVFDGILYWLSNKPEWLQKVHELETEYGILVYHCYFYRADYGDVLDCLYVSAEPDTWDMTVEDSEDGIARIYAINLTNPDFSEFGSGMYKPRNGGISKTA